VEGIGIGIRVNSDRAYAHFIAGPDDSYGNFAAIGD
jgi:hypothetical protein